MKKILIVVDSIDIDDSSGSKVNVGLIQNLYKIGYVVNVLHYTRKIINIEGVHCISIKEKKFTLNYLLSRAQRIMQRIFNVNLSEFLENILGHSFTFFNDSKSITKAINKHHTNEDLIITLSKGGSFRPHHALLSLPKLHSKWMAYIHDPYPFHYYPRPYNWIEKGYKYKEYFFRVVSEKATYSAFPSLLLKEWMGSYFTNFLKTGVVIPHQNLEIKFSNNIKIPNYLGKSKFNILHAGNLMKQRSPEGLIKGYKLFLNKYPEAIKTSKLILLGNASYHKEYLKQEMDENIYWSKGNVSFEEVDFVQKNVSVNVILESKSEISPFLPGKFPHCVSANKPILLLSPYYSESKRLLGENYKYICEVDAVEEIAGIIEDFYSLWKTNQNAFYLNRSDLEYYLSKENLYDIIQKKCFND